MTSLFPLRNVLNASSIFCTGIATLPKRETGSTGYRRIATACNGRIASAAKKQTGGRHVWTNRQATIIVGAVSYCDGVSTIWEGMRQYFLRNNVHLDFVLFTSYERQLECLLAGQIDIAWNGPVAHARLQGIAKDPISLGMRDVDRDFVSYIVPTIGSGIRGVGDIEGKRLATGTFDSPQAYILPLHYLKTMKVDLSTVDVTRFDRDIGKHGDTAIGEIDVIHSLREGTCDAGIVSKMMLDRRDVTAVGEGNIDMGGIIAIPVFDHCQFDCLSSLSKDKRDSFQTALFKMDWRKKEDRVVMQSEGIREKWVLPSNRGYDTVCAAIQGEIQGEGGIGNEGSSLAPPPHTERENPFQSLKIVS